MEFIGSVVFGIFVFLVMKAFFDISNQKHEALMKSSMEAHNRDMRRILKPYGIDWEG
jgi:hypothetical protein